MLPLTPSNPWPLLTATAALVAFHIGLYTLVGRERKSPFVINDIFPVFLLCLLVAAVTIASFFLSAEWALRCLFVATAILLLAVGWSLVVVYRTTIRFIYFVDRINVMHWPGIRHWKRFRSRTSQKPTYSHNALPIEEDLIAEVIRILNQYSPPGEIDAKRPAAIFSIAVRVEKLAVSKEILVKLAQAFLDSGNYVQYITAATHPIDFIKHLSNAVAKDWQEVAPRVIAIDAYSSHFAFIDSIYDKKDTEVDRAGVTLIRSKRTYAGIHTASSAAFKKFKRNAKDNNRRPTLVIYEATSALTDLESVEQFRIFVRHVMPSEKLWGGMLTVFVETGLSKNESNLLDAYADLSIDAKLPTKPAGAGEQRS